MLGYGLNVLLQKIFVICVTAAVFCAVSVFFYI